MNSPPGAWSLGLPVGLVLLAILPLIAWLHVRRLPGPRLVVPALAPWLILVGEKARRRRRVPPTILLALHLLIGALIALAVIDPGRHGAHDGSRDRVFVIDTTSSMAAGDRWPEAVALARRLARADAGAVSLVTMGPEPRVVIGRQANGDVVATALARLRPGGAGAAVNEALELAWAMGGPEALVTVISDGGVEPPDGAGADISWITVGSSLPNVAVVEAGPRTVDGDTRLYARVASFADEPVPGTLRLTVDGMERDRRDIVLAPRGVHETVWQLSARDRWAEVRLDAADALPDDNAAIVPVNGEGLQLQVIGGAETILRALAAMPGLTLHSAGAGSYRVDGGVDVTVVISTELGVLPPGGVVFFGAGLPGGGPDGESGTEAWIDGVGDHPISRGLDLQGARLTGVLDQAIPPWAQPVLEAGGSVVGYAGTLDGTRVAVFPFDVSDRAIADRLAFPMLVARSVEWAAGGGWPAVIRSGHEVPMPLAPAFVRGPDGRETVWRGGNLVPTVPGRYEVRHGDGPEARIARLGVLAGDPDESDLEVRWPGTEGDREVASIGLPGTWGPWLAALALAFLALEAAWRAGLVRTGTRAP